MHSTQITESVIDPRVQLKPWNVDVKKTSYYGPLNNYSVVDIRSTNLTVSNLMKLPLILQEPEYHLVHLRSTFDMMNLEASRIVPITLQLHAACAKGLDLNYYKAYTMCESSICVLQTLIAVIRRTLQIFHPHDSSLLDNQELSADVILASAKRAWDFRPLGTTFMPKTLCMAWATTDNPNIKARIEDMIDSYREDFRGDSWTKLALRFEQRFEVLRQRIQAKMPYRTRQDTTSPESSNPESEIIIEL
jgi:hypothetical protein